MSYLTWFALVGNLGCMTYHFLAARRYHLRTEVAGRLWNEERLALQAEFVFKRDALQRDFDYRIQALVEERYQDAAGDLPPEVIH